MDENNFDINSGGQLEAMQVYTKTLDLDRSLPSEQNYFGNQRTGSCRQKYHIHRAQPWRMVTG